MFLFKRSKIVVDCFTFNPIAYDLFPIQTAINFIPDWWKNAPKEYTVRDLHPTSTIKRCPGIVNQYKYGFIIPLWSDLAIATRGNDDWEIQFSDPRTSIESHNPQQWASYADPNKFFHAKLKSPWAIKTKQEVYWSYSKPLWNFAPDDDLYISSGTLEFKNQNSSHINIFIPKARRDSRVISAGQPMIHAVPMSDKNIEIKTHLIDEQEYNSKYTNQFNYSFTKGYSRAKNVKKAKKCPFHF